MGGDHDDPGFTDEQIGDVAGILEADGISADEQDEAVMRRYAGIAAARCGTDAETSIRLVGEALLYLKLKASDSSQADPLQDGARFGAGFS